MTPANPGRASTVSSTHRQRTDFDATRTGVPPARRTRSAALAPQRGEVERGQRRVEVRGRRGQLPAWPGRSYGAAYGSRCEDRDMTTWTNWAGTVSRRGHRGRSPRPCRRAAGGRGRRRRARAAGQADRRRALVHRHRRHRRRAAAAGPARRASCTPTARPAWSPCTPAPGCTRSTRRCGTLGLAMTNLGDIDVQTDRGRDLHRHARHRRASSAAWPPRCARSSSCSPTARCCTARPTRTRTSSPRPGSGSARSA